MSRSLVIIGGGPRTLGALERLLAHDVRDAGIERIDVLSDDGLVGPGWVYRDGQPDLLRLNVGSASVTAWPSGDGPSLDEWRNGLGYGIGDQYPPRALVGRYLREQADRVIERLRDRIPVRVRRIRVVDVVGMPGAWSVVDARGVTLGPWSDVLLATGHERDWAGALHHTWSSRVPMHRSVLPIDRLLDRPELRDGARVVIRGAGLTAIDAVLALTDAYRDLRISLVSRTVRPMHPKTAIDIEGLSRLPALIAARRAVRDGEPLRDLLARTAIEVAASPPNRADGSRLLPAIDPEGTVKGAVSRLNSPTGAQSSQAAHAELGEAIDVARGHAPVTGEWALAQVWRDLYPSLVQRQARSPIDSPLLGDPALPQWARELERWAFGPPPATAATMLALLDRGQVTMRGGPLLLPGEPADLVVDAVLPPPGIRHTTTDSLVGRMAANGLIRPAREGRGAVVGADAAVPDASGLWLIGRATEDVVLGNDTLVRSLHPTLDLWARAILRQETACVH